MGLALRVLGELAGHVLLGTHADALGVKTRVAPKADAHIGQGFIPATRQRQNGTRMVRAVDILWDVGKRAAAATAKHVQQHLEAAAIAALKDLLLDVRGFRKIQQQFFGSCL